MEKYDHLEIETKWQRVWEGNGLYKTPEPTVKRPKKYILDMYPYPSGAVLHVGHMEGYVATDVVSRYLRMKGYSVLHPMGWDAFGLPAENYAIKTGVPPDKSTHKNIDTFRGQLKLLGLSYDWEREVDTSSPDYYKWTQWLFTVLFKIGLAYKKKAPANWCPSCETVLANEQVVDGVCERCGTEVVQKDLDQWFFKITAYADALIDDLDKIDWPRATKLMQKNWIGRSEGINFRHKVKDMDLEFEVYDSKPQTYMAQTFIVIAPEHPLVKKLVEGTECEKPVMDFVERIKKKKASKSFDVEKEKEGVFTGRYSENYVGTGRDLPIWVASFVLADYGTGIVGSSAHDSRDFEFAKEHNLPILPVMFPEDQKLAERVRNKEIFYMAPDGILQEPTKFSGMKWDEAREPIMDYIEKSGFGRRAVNYHLRDWLVSRQRYWGAPIPMIYCEKCDWQPVAEGDLPVLLPTDVDFEPKGESPIAKSKSFQKGVSCPKCHGEARREVDTMDTFVDSSWYFLRFCSPKDAKQAWDRKEVDRWMPVDTYVGGGHTVQHLLFSRFFQKALIDAGLLDKKMDEPFMRLEVPGWILGPDSRKMSKRWNNVITPDDVVKKFGADTMRIYEMFMAPFEVDKPWNVNSVAGVRRFVDRICRRMEVDLGNPTEKPDPVLISRLNKLVIKVGSDIDSFNFNTAIAAMMAFLNEWEKSAGLDKEGLSTFIKILAPFAPHLAEELWSKLGHKDSIHVQSWPDTIEVYEGEDEVTIVVSVNGKPRATKILSRQQAKALEEKELVAMLQSDERLSKYLSGKVKRTVYVPGKIINFVV